MKKKSIVIIVIILAILSVLLAKSYLNKNDKKEKGDITSISILPDVYDKLQGRVWTGQVNNKELYFAFQPDDYKEKTRNRECLIYEKKGNYFLDDSYYIPEVSGKTFKLKLDDGPINELYSGEYKDGTIYINGIKLKEIDPKDAERPLYNNGITGEIMM